MITSTLKLKTNIFEKDVEQAPTRDGFGKGVVEAGEKNPNVVVICADLAESTRAQWFKDKYPNRYVEMGVAEQNLAAVASGMAAAGKIPFIASYAAFSPGRNYEQIRTTVALNEMPVKVCGMHAGVSVGPDGATHQMLEDVGLMRMLPNMTVIVPCDAEEARKATFAAGQSPLGVYLRFGREKTPIMTSPETPYEIGKAYSMWEPTGGAAPDVAIVGCGALLHFALFAAKELEETEQIKVSVLNLHTIKPIDRAALIAVAKAAKAVVTVEEHQIAGGMGSAVAEVLAEEAPVPIAFVGMRDQFGQSGEPPELMAHYGMDQAAIMKAVRAVKARK